MSEVLRRLPTLAVTDPFHALEALAPILAPAGNIIASCEPPQPALSSCCRTCWLGRAGGGHRSLQVTAHSQGARPLLYPSSPRGSFFVFRCLDPLCAGYT